MTVLNRVRNLFSRSRHSSDSAAGLEPSGPLYAVAIPGEDTVMVRAKNQTEARAFVREARGLTRLPAGTRVDRT